MVISATTVSNLFNKGGYRLVSKITGQVEPNMPAGAVSKTICIIEHISGKKQAIHRYLNAEGKAVRIIRANSDSNIGTLSDFTWLKPKTKNPDTSMYREKIDPYAFENYGVSKNTLRYDQKTLDILENTDTVVDIHAPSRTVTKSFASRITPTGKASDGFTDESRLTEIVNGKKTKEIYQRSTGTPDTVNTITETKGFGVTQQELDEATSNPYFYAMFKSPINWIKAVKTQAYANQGIPQTTGFKLTELKDRSSGYYRPKEDTIYINVKPIRKGLIRPCTISTLEHEARHKWQEMLVEKYEKGLLTDPKEIKMAQEFKNNFSNYIPMSQNYKAYETQPVEADAYKVTDWVYEKYAKAVNYLQRLFPRATRRTLGE